MRKRLVWALAAVAVADLGLLLSGYRILIWQTKVEPGQHYVAAEWGDLAHNQQASLVCRYFTGLSVRTNVLWYSPNNILGRDECPFLVKPE